MTRSASSPSWMKESKNTMTLIMVRHLHTAPNRVIVTAFVQLSTQNSVAKRVQSVEGHLK